MGSWFAGAWRYIPYTFDDQSTILKADYAEMATNYAFLYSSMLIYVGESMDDWVDQSQFS